MKKNSLLELVREQRAGFAKKGGEASSHASTHALSTAPFSWFRRLVQELGKAASQDKAARGRLGTWRHESNGGSGIIFWEAGRLQEVPYGNSVPILAQTLFIHFETLPSPVVMYWHVAKKHIAQEKGFWQPYMCVRYCTTWGFIMWLQWQRSSISHFGTSSKRDLVLSFLHTEMIKKQELGQYYYYN